MSAHPLPTAIAARPLDVRAIRSGAWALIAAFVTFAIGVVTVNLTAADRLAAENAAAKQLDVPVADLTAADLARVSQDFPPTSQDLVNVSLLVFGTVIFVVAIATLRLAPVATVLAVLTPVAWVAYLVTNVAITNGGAPPDSTLALYDDYAPTAMAISTVAGCLALAALVVALRQRDLARRTGLVVLVLAAIGAVAAVAVGVPPMVPVLLGAVLGIALVRTAE